MWGIEFFLWRRENGTDSIASSDGIGYTKDSTILLITPLSMTLLIYYPCEGYFFYHYLNIVIVHKLNSIYCIYLNLRKGKWH